MSIEGTIHRLAETENEKDIGVMIDSKFSFDEHINMNINKATRMLRVIRNTFQFLDKNILIPPYKTMVRSHFDYAASVWNPYLKKHIIAIESTKTSNKINTRDERQIIPTATEHFTSAKAVTWRHDRSI